jgi:WD40 repeat protein/DNA-binding SARP family transcriptional activator
MLRDVAVDAGVARSDAPPFEVRLLGSPQFLRDGQPVEGFVTRKARALLIYLACSDRPQAREVLAAMFWPELSEGDASNNLRRVLPNLRKLAGDVLRVDRQQVMFTRLPLVRVDAARLKDAMRLIQPSLQLNAGQAAALADALDLYTSDFLEGFHLPEAPAFDEWAFTEREHLRALAQRGWSALTEHYLNTDQVAEGLSASERLLMIEPWHEAGHRQRMLLLARSGERVAALQQFQSHQRSLADSFRLPPAPETTALYKRIKAEAEAEALTTSAQAPLPQTQASPPITPATNAAHANELAGIPSASLFIGRHEELTQLGLWHLDEHDSVIAILGIGGAGKSALAARYARALFDRVDSVTRVDRVLWASLLNAPPCTAILRIWLRALADQHLAELPDTADELLALLFRYLRDQRCLLVLDNFESVVAERGALRAGHEDYGLLLQAMSQRTHGSCLLLTSRNLPSALTQLARAHSGVRVLSLAGLPVADGAVLLAQAGIAGERAELVRRYSGNPLALKLAADAVRDLFRGDVEAFLAHGTPVFGDIQAVLDEQVNRLGPLERELLTALAVAREPMPVRALLEELAMPADRSRFLRAIQALQHSSLIEAAQGGVLALQNVVTEYLTDRLLQSITADLAVDRLDRFGRHPLVNARAYEHVQDSQRRVLLRPIADWAVERWRQQGTVRRLETWLEQLRNDEAHGASYAAANLLHLLVHLQAEMAGLDFSHLTVRQADLRTPLLGGVNFAGAKFRNCAFTNTLGVISALAISADGRWLATGGSDGGIFLWRMPDFQLHATLHRHTDSVSALSFSHDSQTLASGGYDGQVCLWDVSAKPVLSKAEGLNTSSQDGQLIRALTTRSASITALSLYRDGDALAIVEPDNVIRLWDWRRETLLHTLTTNAMVTGLAISPDESTLTSVGDHGDINIWRLETGERVRQLHGHGGKILSVAFHPHGGCVATGGEDGQICIWDAPTGDLRHVIKAHSDFVLSLAYSQDGTTLGSSGADGTICLWDAEVGCPRRTLVGHRGWVKAVAFAADGITLVSGGYDQTVRLWDTQAGQEQHVARGHLRWVNYLKFSNDGRMLASASLDGAVRIWDAESGSLLHALNGPQAATRNLAFSPNDALLASVGDDRLVRLWDARSGNLLHALSGHTASVRVVNFSLDGRTMMSGSNDRSIRIWDVESGQLECVISQADATFPRSAGFMPRQPQPQSRFAFGTYHNTVEIVDSNTGEALLTLDTGAASPSVVAFEPQCRLLACGTNSGDILVWDTANPGKPRFRLSATAATSPIWRILFSRGSSKLAWVNASSEISLLDLESGWVSEPMPSHYGAFCVAFSSDGERLITDGPDHTVLIRDAASGEVQHALRGHAAIVTSIEAHPANNMIASSSADGAIRLWDGMTGKCLTVLEPKGPYAGMNITGATGITPAQRETLLSLGAIDGKAENKSVAVRYA